MHTPPLNGLSSRPLIHIIPRLPVVFIVDCYCGEGGLENEVRPEKCNKQCIASPDACGGPGYVAIYDIPLPADTPQAPPEIAGYNGGISYLLGCYKYDTNTLVALSVLAPQSGPPSTDYTNAVRIG